MLATTFVRKQRDVSSRVGGWVGGWVVGRVGGSVSRCSELPRSLGDWSFMRNLQVNSELRFIQKKKTTPQKAFRHMSDTPTTTSRISLRLTEKAGLWEVARRDVFGCSGRTFHHRPQQSRRNARGNRFSHPRLASTEMSKILPTWYTLDTLTILNASSDA